MFAKVCDAFGVRVSLVRLTVEEYIEIDAGCELPSVTPGRLRATYPCR
jgi:hypothetical protein